MNQSVTSSTARRAAGIGLALGAVGIPLQIAGGADYPVVPPGLLISLAGAALYFFAPWRWAAAAGLLVTIFFWVGAIATPNVRDQLGEPGEFLTFSGTVVQVIGLVIALAYGLAAARQAFGARSA